MTSKQNTPKKSHFIGICGVAMSAVATALWQKGWKVPEVTPDFSRPFRRI